MSEQTESLTTESVEEKISKMKYSKKYIIILIFILGLAHILDEYSSIAPSMIQSSLIQDFFINNGISETQGLQTMNSMMIITIFMMLFSNFFKGLQDKYGRKRIFLISAIGMTTGVLIESIAPNYPIYFIGSAIGSFFLFNDMQYVYINEETPTNKRAQAFTAAKIIGLSAIFLVPVIRGMFITEEVENWRPVLYFPVVIGVIVIILTLIFLKETRAFQILKEDRKINPEKYQGEKITFKNAVRDLKKTSNWNQIKWIIIVMIVAAPFAMLNSSYSEMFMDQLGYLQTDRNIVLKLSILGTGIAYLIQGQITDRLGRKPSYIINTVAVLVLVPIEYYALLHGKLILAGFTQGIRIGAYWNITDVNRFMLIENAPTRLRGYTQTLAGLLMFIMMPISIIATTILLGVFPYVYDLLLYFGLPFVFVSLILIIWKLKETVNVDITKIEG
ncbi:MAG: MFS transporter [Promethearchaeota archaeon]